MQVPLFKQHNPMIQEGPKDVKWDQS